MIPIDDWRGCYGEPWTGLIVPDAFAHPAKFSRALIRRIYQHIMAEGWAGPGDVVIDPFGGVALGALDAQFAGLTWVGRELEQRFVDLGQKNLDLWQRRYSTWLGWGAACIVRGDSRQPWGDVLMAVKLAERIMAAVSSPPYVGALGNCKNYSDETKAKSDADREFMGQYSSTYRDMRYSSDPANLGNLPAGELVVSSPPYNPPMSQDHNGTRGGRRGTEPSEPGAFARYGNTPGQLEGLPMGEPPGLSVASPPFYGVEGAHSANKFSDPEGSAARRAEGYASGRLKEHYASPEAILRSMEKANAQTYGDTPGQLANMAVSSPPFGEGETRDRSPVQGGYVADCITRAYTQDRQGTTPGNLAGLSCSSPPYETGGHHDHQMDAWNTNGGGHGWTQDRAGYGETDGQVEGHGETFWSAARQIVEQLYMVLRPGGHAVWVVKAFVRDGKLVDFPGQWRALCESVGFVALHEHHALLTEDRGTQIALNGDRHKKIVESKSFFRRLAEKKGSPRIDYEVVLCMIRS